jgi:RND superfamily putative drug exporter
MRTLSDAASNVGQSARADAVLSQAGIADPATEEVLVRSAGAGQTARAVAALVSRAGALAGVRSVLATSPSPAGPGARTRLVTVTLRGDPDAADRTVAPLQSVVGGLAARTPGVTFLETGDGSAQRAVNQVVDDGLRRAELISVPLTLIILVLAFGALVAACVPLLLGVTSVAAALGALGLVSHIAPDGSSTAPVVVLIGLAVGVDYSLFYIRRERVERDAGAGRDAALDATAATVGRAILVAGATVAVGLAGLLFTGIGVFTSMALGAILVLLIAVTGSLTVLPAALSLLGDRVDRGRLWRRRPGGRPARRRHMGLGWHRLAQLVTARPRVSLAIVVAVLVGLAAPVLAMRTASPGIADLPSGTPAAVAYRAAARAFPGATDTAELVLSARRLGGRDARRRLLELGGDGERLAGGRGALSLRVSADGETALVAIPVRDTGLAAARRDVWLLRDRLPADAARLLPGSRALVTGFDAEGLDFTQRLSTVTPLVIGFVLALAFVLLVAAFRSPALAVSVMGLNLLSVGAAFGVLVAVFQHAWAQRLLGFTSDGAIVDWLPLFAFVILFGLSMDYTVLILERGAEARRAGADARTAAAQALAATGSTVTSAAVVMVAVFSVFATLPLLEFKQLGVGLAAAVALDATLVRGIALPAALTILGDRGLRPARVRDRARAAGWDHLSHAPALEASHD